jgi:hypothetical protein
MSGAYCTCRGPGRIVAINAVEDHAVSCPASLYQAGIQRGRAEAKLEAEAELDAKHAKLVEVSDKLRAERVRTDEVYDAVFGLLGWFHGGKCNDCTPVGRYGAVTVTPKQRRTHAISAGGYITSRLNTMTHKLVSKAPSNVPAPRLSAADAVSACCPRIPTWPTGARATRLVASITGSWPSGRAHAPDAILSKREASAPRRRNERYHLA